MADDRSVAPPPDSGQDPLLYRMVVGALGLGVVLTVLGGIALGILGNPVPESVVAIGAACVGALAGILAPTPQ